jgi:hypothetical protein
MRMHASTEVAYVAKQNIHIEDFLRMCASTEVAYAAEAARRVQENRGDREVRGKAVVVFGEDLHIYICTLPVNH